MEAIATIFSFCSNDWRFFDRCIEGVRPFSSQILVTVCDHFFDGSPENYALLEFFYKKYPEVTFIEFSYSQERSYCYASTLNASHHLWRHEWHNTGRWIAYFFLNEQIEYLYFCDGDEISDSFRFVDWLKTGDYQYYSAIRFACYWYFRSACYRALEKDDMCLWVRKQDLDPQIFWNEHERMGVYLNIKGNKKEQMKGCDGKPLVHHYSWVRTEAEMYQKFHCWGHFWERDWKKFIQEEYARPFSGTDFIRQYRYEQVEPFFDPLALEAPLVEPIEYRAHLSHIEKMNNVKRVSAQQMFQKELQYLFDV